jgi:ribosome-interacting GTPase 1
MYNGAKIQILDLPGIIQGAKDGKGRGRQVIAVAKTCHLIFIVLDVNKPLVDKRVIENELEGFGIRINKSPPNIVFRKKDKGGIAITSTVPLTNISPEVSVLSFGALEFITDFLVQEIKAVMNEYKISSADISIRCDATIDDLIDVLEAKSRAYIPVVYALNKIDAISIEELDLLYRIPNAVPISSEHGWNIDELLEMMWEKLNLRRIYTKPKGRAPDYTAPVVLRASGCTVEDFVSISLPATVHWTTLTSDSVMPFTEQSRTSSSMLLCTVGLLSTSRSESALRMSSLTRILVRFTPAIQQSAPLGRDES